METACKVYTKLMFQRGHGYPLWEPEPNEAGELLIGDVGYILDGGFYRLFNATLPADHPVNQRCGVPDSYEPFLFPQTLVHRRDRALEPRPLCSKSVVAYDVQASVAVGSPGPGFSGGFRFKCSDEQGAVLVLKQPGRREMLHPCLDLTQYIVHNHLEWCAFARDVCRLDIGDDEIIFVSGFVKTAEWALAAATHRAREGELFFGGEFGCTAKAVFSVSATREESMSVEHRTGPHRITMVASTEESTFDQCVFLHYHKLKRRKLLSPKVIRAAGGEAQPDRSPSESPERNQGETPPSNDSSPSTTRMAIERVPATQERYDPLDVLLDYLLAHDGVQCAVATDYDWHALLKDGECLPEDILRFLCARNPDVVITHDGVGALSMHFTPANTTQSDTPDFSASTSQSYERLPTRPLFSVGGSITRSMSRHSRSWVPPQNSRSRSRRSASRMQPRAAGARRASLAKQQLAVSGTDPLGFPEVAQGHGMSLKYSWADQCISDDDEWEDYHEESEGFRASRVSPSEEDYENRYDGGVDLDPPPRRARGRPVAPKTGLAAARRALEGPSST
ncbi:hypothetical protein OH77DRAFT_1486696 [Trametes cingulata]|nr:hypothetical protein OH77DRAFT_1486696 [Trametes cingulata]